MNDSLDINALSQATGISVRTIRYYLAQNLLPPPFGRGPAATYGLGHRDRLKLIRRLQDVHLPLAEIRKQLQALDDAGIAQALDAPAAVAEPPALNAYDYVRQVLAKTKSSPGDLNLNQPPPGASLATDQAPCLSLAPSSAPGPIKDEAGTPLEVAAPTAGATTSPAAPSVASPTATLALGPRKPQRSNWERITLHPDIELHVRRPLARADQRRLDELLDQAQRIFGGDGG
jgi:DNA-binding transcriptional MerR regulator